MTQKVFTLPCEEEMLERLKKVSSNSHYIEYFYPIFLKEAGREIYGTGVTLMITLAIEDYTQNLPTPMKGLLHHQMANYIRALITDEEALEEALAFYKEAKEKTLQEANEVEPAKVCQNYELFLDARKIAKKLFDYTTPNPRDKKEKYYVPWIEDRRAESVNPFYCQTETGLILEISVYGTPSSIWTPWGEWNCWGGGSHIPGIWELILPLFLHDIGAEEKDFDKSIVQAFYPEIGKLYQITKINGKELPIAEPRHKSRYSTYDDIHKVWRQFEFKAEPFRMIFKEMKDIAWEIKRKIKNLF